LSKIEVNEIDKQNGSTLTIGGSGTTVQLGTGASQTGFGRTGTVDWQTGSIKTTTFVAANGEGYFVNTSGGAVTMTLPASPSAGNIVSVKDYAYSFATHNLTVGRNGSPIGGLSSDDVTYSTNGTALTFIYVDGTKGWLVINESTDTSEGEAPAYVTASGGNATLTVGDFKTHVFTGPGTFTVSCAGNARGSNKVDYFVVGGGGSGGAPHHNGSGAGGGGAGGFRVSNSSGCIAAPLMSPLIAPACSPGRAVSAQGYPIVVGGGGAGVTSPPSTYQSGNNGIASSFNGISSAGGGAGSGGNSNCHAAGAGGSGGGSGYNTRACAAHGQGNTPSVSPPQGEDGGSNSPNTSGSYAAAAGGGAGAAGGTSPANNVGGTGGAGSFVAESFFGPTASSYGTPGPVSSTRYFAGGGGGGGGISSPYPGGPITGGPGGAGGGGQGGGDPAPSRPGVAGTTNTGGGSGGGSSNYSPPQVGNSLAGGPGFVAIRYKFQN